MENVQNKEEKGEVVHSHNEGCACSPCHGGCGCGNHGGHGTHGMMCGGNWRGWHGRYSILRIAVGVFLLVGAFCAGSAFGEMKVSYRGDRGYGMHQRMGGYGNYRTDEGYGNYGGRGPGMMFYGQQLPARTVTDSASGTTTVK